MNLKRVESIDLAKGIGILLVILGHLNTQGQFERYLIFAFHMPLFFMLSGIFAKSKRRFGKSFKKLITTIYVPYITMVIFDALARLAFNRLAGDFKITEVVTHTVKCAVGLDTTYFNVAIWFLFALFIIKSVFLLINLIKSRYIANIVIIVIMAASAAFVLLSDREALPKNIMFISAIPGFFFFGVGYLLREPILSLEKSVTRTKIHLLIVPVALIIFALFANQTGEVDTRTYKYSIPYLYLLNALIGCYIMMVLCAYLANCEWKFVRKIKHGLLFFGENSIIVLITHYYLARPFVYLFYTHFGLEKYMFRRFNELIWFVIITLIMIPTIWIFNKYFYFVIGKKRDVLN